MAVYRANSANAIEDVFCSEGDVLHQVGFKQPFFRNPEEEQEYVRYVAKTLYVCRVELCLAGCQEIDYTEQQDSTNQY